MHFPRHRSGSFVVFCRHYLDAMLIRHQTMLVGLRKADQPPPRQRGNRQTFGAGWSGIKQHPHVDFIELFSQDRESFAFWNSLLGPVRDREIGIWKWPESNSKEEVPRNRLQIG